MGQTIKEMTDGQLIDECIRIDREQKKGRALLNGYKAELQARGLPPWRTITLNTRSSMEPKGVSPSWTA